MFTGIVDGCGTVRAIRELHPGCRLTIACEAYFARAEIGASVAVNGCCLTLVAGTADLADFEAGDETLSRTNLGQLAEGAPVNLEHPLRVGDPLGGHWITGHIDGLGTIARRVDDGPWSTCWIDVPPPLTRQMACKGSVAVDGISLTLVEVGNGQFSVALIPHTLAHTTLGARQVGDRVNIETDLLAKYVERLLTPTSAASPAVARP